MATLAQGITYHDGFRKTGGWAFYIHPGLHWSWTELQVYNMIPFHGIRSSFGTMLAFFFFFISWLSCMWRHQNFLYFGRLVGKSLSCRCRTGANMVLVMWDQIITDV